MKHDTNACCQACGMKGVEMFDICAFCRWENDFSLESGDAQDGSGPLVDVGFVLTPEQRTWGSWANHESVESHLTKFRVECNSPPT